MPRTPTSAIAQRQPSYCIHKAKGLAYVTLDGRQRYLGRANSAESHRRYAAAISQWRLEQERLRAASSDPVIGALRIYELLAAYDDHLERSALSASRISTLRWVMRKLDDHAGQVPIAMFGWRDLGAYRQTLIDAGTSRRAIADVMQEIRLIWRWGVREGYTDRSQLEDLQMLSPLRRGEAREAPRVRPLDDAVIESTLEHVDLPAVAAMVRLQRITGMRPGEVVRLSRDQLEYDRFARVVWYIPEAHKCDRHDNPLASDRRIALGRAALRLIRPHRRAFPDGPLFRQRRAPNRPYTVNSYRQAIARACVRAGVSPAWGPHRLRHTRGTEVRRRYGIEASQAMLGHVNLSTTQVYAARRDDLAARIAIESPL